MQGSRPVRIGEEIRQELADLLSRGPPRTFVTVTHVKVSAGLRGARLLHGARRRGGAAHHRWSSPKPFRASVSLPARPAPRAGAGFQSDESIAHEEHRIAAQEIMAPPAGTTRAGRADAATAPAGEGGPIPAWR
jgi:hypothetical protein